MRHLEGKGNETKRSRKQKRKKNKEREVEENGKQERKGLAEPGDGADIFKAWKVSSVCWSPQWHSNRLPVVIVHVRKLWRPDITCSRVRISRSLTHHLWSLSKLCALCFTDAFPVWLLSPDHCYHPSPTHLYFRPQSSLYWPCFYPCALHSSCTDFGLRDTAMLSLPLDFHYI